MALHTPGHSVCIFLPAGVNEDGITMPEVKKTLFLVQVALVFVKIYILQHIKSDPRT